MIPTISPATIRRTLAKAESIRAAAALLGLSRAALGCRMRRLDIQSPHVSTTVRYDNERRQRALTLHATGANYEEIARQLDIHPTTAREWIRRHGSVRPQPRSCIRRDVLYDIDALRQLRQRRAEGESTRELAAEIGVSDTSLRTAWRRYGIEPAPPSYSHTVCFAAHDPGLLQLLRQRQADGESTASLAAEIGCSDTWLYKSWQRHGINKIPPPPIIEYTARQRVRMRLLGEQTNEEQTNEERRRLIARRQMATRLRAEGASYTAIAKQVGGISKSTAWYWVSGPHRQRRRARQQVYRAVL